MSVIPESTVTDLCDHVRGMAQCVSVMRDALQMLVAGELDAPPRVPVEMASGHLVFTAGACQAKDAVGFRAYDLHHVDRHEGRGEVTVVFGHQAGELKGVVLGRHLGIARTGALGGVAIDCFAALDAQCLGVVGAGKQARAQILAALAVRPSIRACKVWARRSDQVQSFVEGLRPLAPQVTFSAEASARDAVTDADIVITATTSSAPVLQASWLSSHCHLNYVGPKFASGHEVSPDVLTRCETIATDALAQLHSDSRLTLSGDARVQCISRRLHRAPPRSTEDKRNTTPTMFYSLGLAGTEVLLASELLQISERQQHSSGAASHWRAKMLLASVTIAGLVAAAARRAWHGQSKS